MIPRNVLFATRYFRMDATSCALIIPFVVKAISCWLKPFTFLLSKKNISSLMACNKISFRNSSLLGVQNANYIGRLDTMVVLMKIPMLFTTNHLDPPKRVSLVWHPFWTTKSPPPTHLAPLPRNKHNASLCSLT